MATHVAADLTVKEAAHPAGFTPRRIEKDCEEGFVPWSKTKLWLRQTVAGHVPMYTVVYSRNMQSLDGIKMKMKSKRRVWKFEESQVWESRAVAGCNASS